MAFTAQELTNIAASTLDFHMKGPAIPQSIQAKPLVRLLKANQKSFPGGKDKITVAVKGDYTTSIQGYSHNDTVSYSNPANLKRVEYQWKEIHAGIGIMLTELKANGISVTDEDGKSTSNHSDRDMVVLVDLLKDKMDDMTEGWAKDFNAMLWTDGSQDAKEVPGILSILTDTPTTGITGGLDRAATPWWRHRTLIGASKVTASATDQTLSKALRKEARQLRRYTESPKFALLAGSDFIEACELEAYAKGQLTQTGFSDKVIDVGIEGIAIKGLGTIEYDPTLDDMGYSKRLYVIDLNAIKLMPMEGEDMRQHNPSRPYNQYAMYRAITWTGGLVAQRLRSSGIYEVS